MMHINLMEKRHAIQVQSDPIDLGMVLAAWGATMFVLAALLYLVSLR